MDKGDKMTNEEKIAVIAEIMELDEGELSESSVLADYEEWDSMTRLSIVAEAPKIFGKNIDATSLRTCKTIGDILKL